MVEGFDLGSAGNTFDSISNEIYLIDKYSIAISYAVKFQYVILILIDIR